MNLSSETKKHIANTLITIFLTTGVASVVSSDFRKVIAKPWSNTELIKKNHRQIDSTIKVKEVLIRAKFEQIDRASKETQEIVYKNNDNIKEVLERLIKSETKLDMILRYSKKQAFTAQREEEEGESKPAVSYNSNTKKP